MIRKIIIFLFFWLLQFLFIIIFSDLKIKKINWKWIAFCVWIFS